jgi:2-polyprenyl-6-methoxyphenol hydroxylase-like FAD-dependent oxidoreductase
MTKFKISIVSKDASSALTTFLTKQLDYIQWIEYDILNSQTISKSESYLYITLLEEATFQEILDVSSIFRQAKKNTIYISCWKNDLILGPAYIPGRTAGADSCFLFLNQESQTKSLGKKQLLELLTSKIDFTVIQEDLNAFYTAFSYLLSEIKAFYMDDTELKFNLIDSVSMFPLNHSGKSISNKKYIYPLFEGSLKDESRANTLDYKVLLNKYLHSKNHSRGKENYFKYNKSKEFPEMEYNSIAIIGGGTAGYLTALSLKNEHPGLKVTLIESSKIPVIGVGEATTPEIRRFLFSKLKFSPLDFYEKVKPTWKLGIKFFWGQPGDYYFNYPFGTPDVRSAYLVNGNINQASLTSVLMDTNSSFVTSTKGTRGKEHFSSLSDDLYYALHLDNVTFISYLKDKTLEAGVTYIDDLIINAEKKADSNEIQAVRGESGKRYEYDFFVDCTGFKSLLIEKTLGSPFISYNASLFTDTAVTGSIPNSDKIKPYTYAQSMNHGWCWGIPMRREDHRGYVFSSAYCSVDQAADEMQAKNPTIGDLKVVKFRSGRHQEICVGNVFAIGNSFAFVEPLESTGIHMILKEIAVLTQNLPNLKKSPTLRKIINSEMNAHWDYLKGFLSIHYKYNKKFDTPFWKDCRELTDTSSIDWLLDLYHEVGLLSYAGENFKKLIKSQIKDDIFGLVGFDTVLMGQGVIPKNLDRALKNINVWNSHVHTWKSIQSLTIPIESDLKFLAESLERKEWM